MRWLLESAYDSIDDHVSNPAAQFGLRWLLTLLLLLVVVAVVKAATERVLYRVIKNYNLRMVERHETGWSLARELFPESPTPRTAVAVVGRIPDDLASEEFRMWKKARASLPTLPERTLQRWVHLQFRRDCFIEAMKRIQRRLGGVLGVLLALAITLWVKPAPPAISRWFRDWSTAAVDFVKDGYAAKFIPVILLVLGAAVVIGRTPIIDRVRAPVEASKDANKHLVTLLGSLARIQYEQWLWYTGLIEQRSRLVSDSIRHATDGEFEFRSSGVVATVSRRYRHPREDQTVADIAAATDVVAAQGDLRSTLNDISRAGLSGVCFGALIARRQSAMELQLYSYDIRDEKAFTRRFCGPGVLEAMVAENINRLEREFTISAEKDFALDDDVDEKAVRTRRLSSVEERAYGIGHSLDIMCADAMFAQLHCRRLGQYLSRRTVGTALTRTLGAVGKS